MGTLTYLPIVFLVVYSMVGGFALVRLFSHFWQRPLPPIHADPQGWLSSWLPQLIATEVFIMVGGIVYSLLLLFVTGMARRAEAPTPGWGLA
jgi:hypothetical protein